MIVVIDYGIGNLGSIANMLKKIGTAVEISGDPEVIRRGRKLILPGVGAFDAGMRALAERGLDKILTEIVMSEGVPILGICLGTQLMTKRSEEGACAGLGWIDAETIRFKFSQSEGLRIPHMGWNQVCSARDSFLARELGDEPRFYFVHSYHLVCRDPSDVLFTTRYGYEFVSAIHRRNVMGVQFHPEKSHRYGMKLLQNFSEM